MNAPPAGRIMAAGDPTRHTKKTHAMPTNDELLRGAGQALGRGRHDEAERLARLAAEAAPVDPAPWGLLADAQRGLGRLADAVASARQALRLAPGDAEAHHRLALLLREAGERGEAEVVLRRALTLSPDHPGCLVQLGVALAEAGRLGEALPHLGRAARAAPGDARARHNLGVALAQAGRPEEAAAELAEAARLEPGYAEALYNLGIVLAQLGRRAEAIDAYEQALAARPDHHGALNNLGLLLQEANRPAEAIVLLQQAARLRPDAAAAYNNLGLALADLGRFGEAEASHHEALRLDPRYAEAHANLASALKEQGRHDEAMACFAMALRLDPQAKSARYNRSLCLLQMGRWEEGFKEYEYRSHRRGHTERPRPGPRWRGEALAGKTVLLVTEQGLGDAIQFARYAAVLKRQGARVLVECPGYLGPLLSRCDGIDGLVEEGQEPPTFDYHAPLMSAPAAVGTTVETVPWEGPYLRVEQDRLERWRAWLGPTGKFRVGVVWQGNPHFPWDRWRSAPLAGFRPLAGVEGVELVSLQRTHGLDQLAGFQARSPGEELDREAPFVDTMALMRCLDLVVCVDSSVGHLAGALGVPAWLALGAAPDWRWLLGREDTPWYPGTRLFRQRTLGDWDDVFERMAGELRQAVSRSRRPGVALVPMAAGELLDRLTILRIKAERITDAAKLAHVRAELAALEQVWESRADPPDEVTGLAAKLREVNGRLWDVEDALRGCEARRDFGDAFVGLARSVYQLNDQRAGLKRKLDEALEAPWSEPKQYG